MAIMADTYIAMGSTEFPLGTSVQQIGRGRAIGRAKLARGTGMVQTIGYRNGIEVAVTVPICRGPLSDTDFRTRRDAARAMMAVGPARLYAGYTDRYYRCCEAEGEPEDVISETLLGRYHAIRQRIVGPDPFEYSTTVNTNTWVPASGVTHAINVSGGVAAAPTIRLTVGGSGLETIAFTVENETTGEEFTLTGDVTAGDVIAIDCLLLRVLIGTTDRLDLLLGLFPSMSVGANNITVSWSSSSVTSVTVTHESRWD